MVAPILLSRKQSGWMFLWTSTPLYVIYLFLYNFSFLLIYQVIMSTLFWFMQYNFVGRLLGPRGNSLKRVEASTDFRVLIRGCGSIKDPARVIFSFSRLNYWCKHRCSCPSSLIFTSSKLVWISLTWNLRKLSAWHLCLAYLIFAQNVLKPTLFSDYSQWLEWKPVGNEEKEEFI